MNEVELRSLVHRIRDTLRVREDHHPNFIDPSDFLVRASSPQHQMIFGRRGTGKSTLLLHVHNQTRGGATGRSIYLSLDELKKLTYPDVLVQLLIEIFAALEDGSSRSTRREVRRVLESLRRLLAEPDSADVETATVEGRDSDTSIGIATGSVKVGVGSHEDERREVRSSHRTKKIDALERGLKDFKRALARCLEGGPLFLLLDDFYLLKRSAQPDVLDYMHRLVRGTSAYLKVGTVRHRTRMWRDGAQFVGVELHNDVEEIDLDFTIADPSRTSSLLWCILEDLADECAAAEAVDRVISPATHRLLTLAAGGVPRDYLSMVAGLLDEMLVLDSGVGIGADLVLDQAARNWTTVRMPTLQSDAGSNAAALDEFFSDLKLACLTEANSLCFLVSLDDAAIHREQYDLLQQLMDFKHIHLASPLVHGPVRNERFCLFVLDISMLRGVPGHTEVLAEAMRLVETDDAINFAVTPVYQLARNTLPRSIEPPNMPTDLEGLARSVGAPTQSVEGEAGGSGELPTSKVAGLEPLRAEPIPQTSVPSEPAAPSPPAEAVRGPGRVVEKRAPADSRIGQDQHVEPTWPTARRRRLPRSSPSKSFEFHLADCKGVVTVVEFDDGRPGAIFLRIAKQGSTLAGVMDSLGIAISNGLQFGVPLERFVESYVNMRFEPAGMTDDPELRIASSIMDYAFRRIALDYLPLETRQELGILAVSERTQTQARGSADQPRLPGTET